jgi:hypothetical protein
MVELRRANYVENCQECGSNLYPEPPEPLGVFMLSDALWSIASLDGQIACLCLACTEKVLGCPLPSWAFKTDDMLPAFLLTRDLQDRLDPATDGEFTLHLNEAPEARKEIAMRVMPNLNW